MEKTKNSRNIKNRAKALVEDYIIIFLYALLVVIIYSAISKVLSLTTKIDMTSSNIYELIFPIVGIIYFTGSELRKRHATYGKRIMDLKVVDKSGKDPNVLQIIIRNIIKLSPFILNNIVAHLTMNNKEFDVILVNHLRVATIVMIFLLVITTIISKENRGIHDIISHTKIIEVKE